MPPSGSSRRAGGTAGAPGRTALSREVVLSAALDLVDSEGLDALTMRRLGQRLHRDPMALYRYAANRDALLDGVVELVLAQLEVPAVTDLAGVGGSEVEGPGGWRGQLRATAHAFRRLALSHPHVVPLLVTRPLATPLGLRPLGTLRPLEQLLELLVAAGFDPVDALHVYRIFFGFLHGHVLNELQELVAAPEEDDDVLRLGLHRLPLREFPRVRSLASALADFDGAHELDKGLDVLLDGLDLHLHPRA
ncbi:TetR/AcrR family transcriptional regulator [Quadrisphaera setariae]|uniref:TetR/AcrR family transcriptional regulator n=1 Tax=Quadrisphaera setariae TaxID=2593304 RepID=UPI001C9D59A6|nr:TetR/AcrR family transcriptional regulator C-terminal domain-containing protein [Quadrisphaera setariae]